MPDKVAEEAFSRIIFNPSTKAYHYLPLGKCFWFKSLQAPGNHTMRLRMAYLKRQCARRLYGLGNTHPTDEKTLIARPCLS